MLPGVSHWSERVCLFWPIYYYFYFHIFFFSFSIKSDLKLNLPACTHTHAHNLVPHFLACFLSIVTKFSSEMNFSVVVWRFRSIDVSLFSMLFGLFVSMDNYLAQIFSKFGQKHQVGQSQHSYPWTFLVCGLRSLSWR